MYRNIQKIFKPLLNQKKIIRHISSNIINTVTPKTAKKTEAIKFTRVGFFLKSQTVSQKRFDIITTIPPLIEYPYANKNESSNVLPNTNPKTIPNSTPPHTLQIFFKHFFTIFLLFMSFIIFSLNRGTFLLFTHAFCRINNTQSFRTFIGTKNHI